MQSKHEDHILQLKTAKNITLRTIAIAYEISFHHCNLAQILMGAILCDMCVMSLYAVFDILSHTYSTSMPLAHCNVAA